MPVITDFHKWINNLSNTGNEVSALEISEIFNCYPNEIEYILWTNGLKSLKEKLYDSNPKYIENIILNTLNVVSDDNKDRFLKISPLKICSFVLDNYRPTDEFIIDELNSNNEELLSLMYEKQKEVVENTIKSYAQDTDISWILYDYEGTCLLPYMTSLYSDTDIYQDLYSDNNNINILMEYEYDKVYKVFKDELDNITYNLSSEEYIPIRLIINLIEDNLASTRVIAHFLANDKNNELLNYLKTNKKDLLKELSNDFKANKIPDRRAHFYYYTQDLLKELVSCQDDDGIIELLLSLMMTNEEEFLTNIDSIYDVIVRRLKVETSEFIILRLTDFLSYSKDLAKYANDIPYSALELYYSDSTQDAFNNFCSLDIETFKKITDKLYKENKENVYEIVGFNSRLGDYVASICDYDDIYKLLLNGYKNIDNPRIQEYLKNSSRSLYMNNREEYIALINYLVYASPTLLTILVENTNFTDEELLEIFDDKNNFNIKYLKNDDVRGKFYIVFNKRLLPILKENVEKNTMNIIKYYSIAKIMHALMDTQLINRIVEDIKNNPKKLTIYFKKALDDKYKDLIVKELGKEKVREILDKYPIDKKSDFAYLIDLYVLEEDKPKIDYFSLDDTYDDLLYVMNCTKLSYLLQRLGIDYKYFFKYYLRGSHSYLEDCIFVLNNEEKFTKVLDYFEKNIYKRKLTFEEFLSLIMNFTRYTDLCLSILEKDFNSRRIDKLLFLFSREENLTIKVDDIDNVDDILNKYMIEQLENAKSIEDIRNVISKFLFNKSFEQLKDSVYHNSSTEDLVKLEFNNRDNIELVETIKSLEEYTKFIDRFINITNYAELRKFMYSLLEEFSYALFKSDIQDYDKKLNRLYAYELSSNLTHINSSNVDKVYSKELSEQYGVPVYDFRDKKYILLTHTCSYNELIDSLINGIEGEYQKYISLCAISYAGEKVYRGLGARYIVGYDDIDPEAFVLSSITNMSSNSYIRDDSDKLEIDAKIERGVLETSIGHGRNSEIICYRKGIKPKYLIIPNNNSITDKEISFARENGLIIALTQALDTTIDNPKEIPNSKKTYSLPKYNVSTQKILNERLSLVHDSPYRKIAVFGDSHALFEPTLAILEDARRNGITEVYSLGDNVGTGPNPLEVVDLLLRYGVKSLKGNHEEYALDGIDKYREHLLSVGAYAVEEAESNSNWTRNELTDKQLETISKYEDCIELEIGGKKILLCHYTKDYNTLEDKYDLTKYDYIIQGHKHFYNNEGNIYTIRGAGIGGGEGAYYLVIEETESGIKISDCRIDYDKKNTLKEISLKEFNTKQKIKNWI